MKVITIRQPWASLIMVGAKGIETRSWATSYRGPILIHASASIGKMEQELCATEPFKHYLRELKSLPTGCILGKATLRAVYPTSHLLGCFQSHPGVYNPNEKHFGDYTAGRYGWLLSDVVAFQQPIPAKGQLGLWTYNGVLPI